MFIQSIQSILFPEKLKEAESQSASDDRGESTISKDTGPKSLADGEKAPVDLFKAVFQDSDDSKDSDSDSSDEEQVTGTVMLTNRKLRMVAKVSNLGVILHSIYWI